MKCPLCLSEDTKVTDTRVSSDGFAIRRRRECLSCEARFSTSEQLEVLGVNVVKRDGRREPYDREKLFRGMERALEKLPVTPEQSRGLVLAVEVDLHRLRKEEVDSHEIGAIAMRHLKEFNPVAYIRFASVYGAWQDPALFLKEIRAL